MLTSTHECWREGPSIDMLRLGIASYPVSKCWGAASHTWASLGIDSAGLQVALSKQGLGAPSPVQAISIPSILAGSNCAIQSHTGSGKTLAYLLPAVARVLQQRAAGQGASRKAVLAAVVSPSRELCMQVLGVARSLLPPDQQQLAQQVIGGANPKRQHEALRRFRPALVVGTPGRLLDLVDSGALSLEHCPLLVLDEVDRLASAEFRDETARIVRVVGSRLEQPRQTVVVSASLSRQLLHGIQGWCPQAEYISTHGLQLPEASPATAAGPAAPLGAMPSATTAAAVAQASTATASTAAAAIGVDRLASECQQPPVASAAQHTRNPSSAAQTGDQSPEPSTSQSHAMISKARLVLPPGVQHYYVLTSRSQSLEVLVQCVKAMDVQRALVFAGSQRNAMHVRNTLVRKRVQATVLHSELSKLERTNILNAFRRGVFRAMVVTDVASRGLDFPQLDAVFNLGLPEDVVTYAHRAGRTNRLGGVAGTIVSIIKADDEADVQLFARRLGIEIKPSAVSFGKWVAQAG